MEERIDKAILQIFERMGVPASSLRPFSVGRPENPLHGDYYTNAALVKAKYLGKNPSDLAVEVSAELKKVLGDLVSDVIPADPGYINILLSREAITSRLIEAQSAEWGRGKSGKNYKVFIEYSNPNPFKEMHIGHLVGTVIGEAIARLVSNSGAAIKTDTFGGDIGPHVAKQLWNRMQQSDFGQVYVADINKTAAAYVKGSRAYEDSPEAKKEIDTLNKRLYNIVLRRNKTTFSAKEKELFELWKRERTLSMNEFNRIWKVLEVKKFDYKFFDSQTVRKGLRVVRDNLGTVFKKGEGDAVIYDGKDKGVHTMVFITAHGTPTYEAKDIGLAFLKEKKWSAHKVLIVTGNEQSGRFETVRAALKEINQELANKMEHLPTGFLKLASGKMSSREGNVITAKEFIKDVVDKAAEKNNNPLIAEQVAIGAIKYMILRQGRGSDIIFDKEKSLSLQGDSGPYLQYALVRARSVLANATKDSSDTLTPEKPYLLERLIGYFPEVAEQARNFYMPNILTTYLTELAGEWNSFYAKERIIGDKFEAHKLLIARAFAQTMSNGLALLAIPAPVKM